MALLLSDGFDSHVVGAAVLASGDPKWGAQVGVAISSAAGKFAGHSLQLAAATVGSLTFAPAPVSSFVGFAMYVNAAALTNPAVLLFDGAQSLVTLNADRSVTIKDGAGTTRITTAAGAVPVGYNWIEVSYRNGSINFNVTGVPVGTVYTGAYTAPSYTAMKLLNITSGTGIGQIDIDDFICWDDSGSFFNTFGLTPRRIQLLRPSANGSQNDWTKLGATNWQSADAADWSGGAGNTSNLAAQKDLYQLTDLAINPANIQAVVVKTKSQNTGDNPANLTHVVRGADGIEAVGTAQLVPTASFGIQKSIFYRDPNGAAWTATTVNAVQAGQTSS